MNRQLRLTLVLTATVAASAALVWPTRAAEPVFPAIDGNAVLEHTKVLASDAFEGRAPGTKGEELTVAYLTEQLRKIGLQPGNPDGTWVQKVPLVGTTVQGSPSAHLPQGRDRAPARLARRLRRLDEARGRPRGPRRLRPGVRRLRRPGAGVPVGRLQGRGPPRQDDGRARRRPAGARPREAGRARPEDVRRQGDDLLRPLDLQVRDGREARGRGRPHRPRDGARGVSLRDRPGQDHGAVRPADGRRQPGPRRGRGLDHARPGEGPLPDGRAGLRGARGEGRHARVPAGPARGDGVRVARQHDPQGPFRQRRGQARGERPEAQGRVGDLHDPLGPLRDRPRGERRHDLPRRDRQRLRERAGSSSSPGR